MSIKIYTYSNPYELDKEPYFTKLKTAPQFCVSQTMVNGMRYLYGDQYFNRYYLSTFARLIAALYKDWEGPSCAVRQYAALDNIVRNEQIIKTADSDKEKSIRQAFLNNRGDVFNSIRTLFEFGVNIKDVELDKLSEPQSTLLNIYNEALKAPYSKSFCLPEPRTSGELDNIIIDILKHRYPDSEEEVDLDTSSLDLSTIVIHGVHQFTPIMLRAIAEIAEIKKVILLFNYQKQYSQVYKTWIDVYDGFHVPIIIPPHNEFRPTMAKPVSYRGAVLADQLGQLVEGNTKDCHTQSDIEILEFDNITEFANYVADRFEEAGIEESEKESESKFQGNERNPLRYMKEQFYSADMRVNNILKIYFPWQFGERQFLNYPIGHFVIAITNMWDPDTEKVTISDPNDIRECLSAGIIKEESFGQLVSIFNAAAPLFENCHTISEMTDALKKVEKNNGRLSSDDVKEIRRITYYNLSGEEIEQLISALNSIEDIAELFYKDFQNDQHNFRTFYQKLEKFLKDRVLTQDIDDEFRGIVQRVLNQLDQVKDIDANASFECLRDTMQIYLKQESAPGTSAKWIVKGFNQIDGDILISGQKASERTYHFACLSDNDMNQAGDVFPWPLDYDFFEKAQDPVDWKVQVYLNSRRERRNFNRYALIYGLEFNNANFKLSYIHHENDKEKDYLYLLKILGVRKKEFAEQIRTEALKNSGNIVLHSSNPTPYTQLDLYRYRVCHYKFLLESIIEGDTVYKDNYLLLRYFEILLENRVRCQVEGKNDVGDFLAEKVSDEYQELKKYFPFVQRMNRADITKNVVENIHNSVKKGKFPRIYEQYQQKMELKELFIRLQGNQMRENRDLFGEVDLNEVNDTLSEQMLKGDPFFMSEDSQTWCQTCADREVCLKLYQR